MHFLIKYWRLWNSHIWLLFLNPHKRSLFFFCNGHCWYIVVVCNSCISFSWCGKLVFRTGYPLPKSNKGRVLSYMNTVLCVCLQGMPKYFPNSHWDAVRGKCPMGGNMSFHVQIIIHDFFLNLRIIVLICTDLWIVYSMTCMAWKVMIISPSKKCTNCKLWKSCVLLEALLTF